MNILIVEDHESVAAGIAHSLRDEGYQVSICDSALAAIDRLAGARFDLLILDINLKLSSGLDVLQHARTKRLPLAIIILSARNTVDQRIAALDLGADDYLSKPFVMSELLARVRVQARRVAPTAQPEETIGRLTYSPSLRSVRISETDEPIKLTKKELAVFERPGGGRCSCALHILGSNSIHCSRNVRHRQFELVLLLPGEHVW